jgi:2-keto-4-pentenoate hydratase
MNISADNDLSLAQTLLQCHDQHRLLAGEHATFTDFQLAERINAEIINARVARGERRLGYKIGFTNRSIWPIYGVDQPIWAPVYNSSVEQLEQGRFAIAASQYIQPRIEPEIVFGLKRSPRSPALADLVAAIDWFAHGFEIVQSVFPDWKFNGAEAFAAQGLHGSLKIGARHALQSLADPVAQLAGIRISLSLNGVLHAHGRGSNVLDGPIQALSHFASELAKRGTHLQAGDIITTGTLTDAFALSPGQRWHTEFEAQPNSELALTGIELTVGP